LRGWFTHMTDTDVDAPGALELNSTESADVPAPFRSGTDDHKLNPDKRIDVQAADPIANLSNDSGIFKVANKTQQIPQVPIIDETAPIPETISEPELKTKLLIGNCSIKNCARCTISEDDQEECEKCDDGYKMFKIKSGGLRHNTWCVEQRTCKNANDPNCQLAMEADSESSCSFRTNCARYVIGASIGLAIGVLFLLLYALGLCGTPQQSGPPTATNPLARGTKSGGLSWFMGGLLVLSPKGVMQKMVGEKEEKSNLPPGEGVGMAPTQREEINNANSSGIDGIHGDEEDPDDNVIWVHLEEIRASTRQSQCQNIPVINGNRRSNRQQRRQPLHPAFNNQNSL